jgi:carbamoyltransferase
LKIILPKILGISAFYHDAAAAIAVDGKILAAAQEERFTRIKHTPDFPIEAIRYCLEETGLSLEELDAVVFYDKPFLKFERLLQTYYDFAPRGFLSFMKAMPVWLREKLFLKREIHHGLKQVAGKYDSKNVTLLFPEHHLSHAASAFYPSPFKDAAILTIDGVGEWCTASICYGREKDITMLKSLHFPDSVGLLYSAFTYYLGFMVNSGEYKLMGLAPYGNPEAEETRKFAEAIEKEIVQIHDDGSVKLNQQYFNYATGLRMVNHKKWEKLFGFPRKEDEDPLEQHHCNLALAIQQVTEKTVLKMAAEAKRLTGSEYLCMAGGVALNCVANGKLLQSGLFKDIYIQPATGDAGGAVGAALAAHHIFFSQNRNPEMPDGMSGTYLGPSFSEKEILSMSRKVKAVFHPYESEDTLCEKVAAYIADGKVVGWFQGRMEFGPRALGNRSILADPRNPEMQKKLNLKIKYREGFRPFAPAISETKCGDWFDLHSKSPYMLLVAPVQPKQRHALPKGYLNMALYDRLYFQRSTIPAVTHLDFSARVQTVSGKTNPRFEKLLAAFDALTGTPILVNTSFNVRGEPIVCTPFDAYRCFMSMDMDVLVVNDYIYIKEEQPDFENKEIWMVNFKKD